MLKFRWMQVSCEMEHQELLDVQRKATLIRKYAATVEMFIAVKCSSLHQVV